MQSRQALCYHDVPYPRNVATNSTHICWLTTRCNNLQPGYATCNVTVWCHHQLPKCRSIWGLRHIPDPLSQHMRTSPYTRSAVAAYEDFSIYPIRCRNIQKSQHMPNLHELFDVQLDGAQTARPILRLRGSCTTALRSPCHNCAPCYDCVGCAYNV